MKKKLKTDTIILSAPYIVPISSSAIKDGAILIDNGRIENIGAIDEVIQENRDIPCRHFNDAILLPGLVNAHVHLEYSVLGPIDSPLDFMPWLLDLIKRHRETDDKDIVSSISSSINDLIASGITCVGEVSKSSMSLAHLIRSGLKGIFFSELVALDNNKRTFSSGDFKLSFEKIKRALKETKLEHGVFAHSVYTLSEDVLREISAFCKNDKVRFAIHTAELKDEREFVKKGTGPLYDFVKSLGLVTTPEKGKYKNTFDYLDSIRFLSPFANLVHSVHIEEKDFPVIENSGASIVLCPKSNHYLNCGRFPFLASLKYALCIGLGTDSLASNTSFDIFEELRYLKDSIRSDSPFSTLPLYINERLLHIATLGGARALGKKNDTGSLSIGKAADIIGVRINEGSDKKGNFSPADYLVDSAGADDVIFTMIDGNVKYDKE